MLIVQIAAAPGYGWGSIACGIRYDLDVLGLLMLAVFVFAWIRRRLMIRREGIRMAEQFRIEAEALAREREIIAEMEADFLRR